MSQRLCYSFPRQPKTSERAIRSAMNIFDAECGGPCALGGKQKSRKRSTTRVTISDCDSPGEMGSTIEALTGLWERGVDPVTLEFRDINQMAPNPALLLYDILLQRPQGATIIAKALSPIMGPGLLVWLGADRRYIRPTAWLYFHPLRQEKLPRARLPWSDDTDWWRQEESQSLPNFMEMDYRSVLRLINNYI